MLKANLNRAETDEVGKQRFNTYRRLKGMLYVAGEELPDSPLFYSVNDIKPVLRMPPIPLADFRSAILNAGYKVSQSHTNPDSIKTTASSSLVWEIILSWYRAKIENESNEIKNGNDGRDQTCDQIKNAADNRPSEKRPVINQMILNREIKNEISFEYNPDELVESRKLQLLRYQMNPTKYWGPMSRPKTGEDATKKDKRILNQNKRKRKLDNLEKDDSS